MGGMLWVGALLLSFGADDQADVADLLRAGRHRDAADVMSLMLEEAPGDQELRVELVQLEMRINRYSAALDHLAQLGPEFDALRGQALHLLGRYEEALAFLSDSDAKTVLFRHEALVVLSRFDEAEAVLERAAELLGAESLEVRVRRGQALARDGDLEAAVVEFRSALEGEPLSLAALFGLGRALIGLDEMVEGLAMLERHRALTPLLDQLDFAQRNLKFDLSRAPNHAAVGVALGALVEFDPRVAQEALAAFVRAGELAQADEIAPIALRHARLLEEALDDPAGAVLVLDAAFARREDARLPVRAGDIWMRASRPAEALKEYGRAERLRPSDSAIAKRIEAAGVALEQAGAPR